MARSRIWILTLGALFVAASPLWAGPPAQPDDAQRLADRIDELIGARLAAANVKPAPPADDAMFYRRLSLDLVGKIPASAEARRYLNETRSDKKRQAIDHLLASPGYAIHYTDLWAALMLPESDADFQKQALQASLSNWLRRQFDENVTYDKWVRDIIAMPLETNQRNQRGFDFFGNRGGDTPMAYYQSKQGKPEDIAAGTARLFLGVRIECAQCHDHPFARWKREQFWGQAAFFAGVRRPGNQMGEFFIGQPLLELQDRREMTIPGTERVAQARFLDDKEPEWKYKTSARVTLADWMTAKDNPFFARAAVNRLWAQLFGAGIVEPIDDFNDENKPTHPELLDEMAHQFAEHNFDYKFLLRAITLSKTYQQSSVYPGEAPPDLRLFSYMPVKGLSAEQFYDSLVQATGYRDDRRGNQNRFFNFGSPRGMFMQKFAAQEKRTEYQTSIPQALALMNNTIVATTTHPDKGETLAAIANAPFMDTAGKVEALYLAALSRKPTPEESARLSAYVDKGGAANDKKKALADVFWALINSTEFLFNH
jgi:hypothetical protein